MRRLAQLLLPVVVQALAAVAALAAPPQAPANATPPDAQAVERARLDRLGAIAAALQAPEADAVALFTEGVRLVGFVVWSEERAVLAEPIGAPRLALAVTDAEIRGYCAMFRAGHGVARDDLLAAIDVLYAQLAPTRPAALAAKAWLRAGAHGPNPSARALHFFLDALGRQRAGSDGAIDADADFDLDPLQALLLVRVLTEEIGTPLRRELARIAAAAAGGQPKKGPWVGEQEPEAPGWAEDAFVGGITGLIGEALEAAGRAGKSFSERAESIGKGFAAVNCLASITKCILTYTYLKGDLRVETPGEPLVRTKTTDPGTRRTLAARFWIDGAVVTDWLKENRKTIALFGLDLDMPKSGELKGVETEWEIKESLYTTKTHLLVLPPGHPSIDRIKTDDDGRARIVVDGAPQARKLPDRNLLPVEKKVRILVKPQVKATEIQQDLVDAVTGAIGIRSGPIGLLTPVIECLYRMKWKVVCRIDLRVLDWAPAETICQAEVQIEASGVETTRDSAYRMSVSRRARFVDLSLDSSGVEATPAIDPSVLAFLPKKQRAEFEKAMAEQAKLAKMRWFNVRGPGRLEFDLRDSVFRRGATDDCLAEVVESTMRRVGATTEEIGADATFGNGNLTMEFDLEKKVAKLFFDVECAADVATTTLRQGKTTQSTSKQECGVFTDLRLDEPWRQEGLLIPIQETPSSDPLITNYYGVAAVPFRFGNRGQFAGKAIVSWSLTRRVAKK